MLLEVNLIAATTQGKTTMYKSTNGFYPTGTAKTKKNP
jgi:hypothetical protein